MNLLGRRVQRALRRWLATPAPGMEPRGGRERARDAWILHGPRWH